MQQRADFPHN